MEDMNFSNQLIKNLLFHIPTANSVVILCRFFFYFDKAYYTHTKGII